ncbi:ATP-dependent DNA helicase [Bacillus lacus]|uniref:ATP-dependent DNA helicase n=1 Tax=Metabacillus lacus TaxID=1983721 RepID=A0A7X2IW75_9BACI|nr:ATP-dependent DNA helicase [Metabacillus lacus]MRX70938.1 ATP-dependent DNA helicase [Metabacillus lacus]
MSASRLPFSLTKEETFYQGLNNWIGDVFYDILPDKGFDLRDEQIFMAFQMERAFREKNIMFAEAGVGTGKTIVYLLYAIIYARYTGKPAIIACADETLIEQLVKDEGDIQKIAKHLNMDVDVRLSKSQSQYLCLNKLDSVLQRKEGDIFLDLYESLPSFVHEQAGMQSFHHYGDRKEFSSLPDSDWERVSWDSFQDCVSCPQRNRCGLTLSRDHYRKAADIIVCSHDFYMEHIWTSDSRKREGQLPLLPEHSSVVFDEGHLLEYAAQKALTYRVKKSTLELLLERLLQNDVREDFAHLVEEAITINDEFYEALESSASIVQGSHRMKISMSAHVKHHGGLLLQKLSEISEALVFEGELYTIDPYELKIVEEYLDQMEYSMALFVKNDSAISWMEMQAEDVSLVIMPRTVEEVLREKVFSRKIPYIFSSATLSNGGDFSYMADSLGIRDYMSMSVESPFDYEEQMELHIQTAGKSHTEEKFKISMKSIEAAGGKTLVLFSNTEELAAFKELLQHTETPYPFLFEGDEEMSSAVSKFQNNPSSVLCAVHLWEGLDIPGESLSNVIIWSLPFPPHDPVFEAKRNIAQDAFADVDLPYMLLRLRQGIGRLIRSSSDQGSVHIFIENEEKQTVRDAVQKVLPVSITV